MRRKVRIGLGVIVLAISIPLFVWGFWPVPRETRIRPVSYTSGPALPENRILTLTYPPRIRAGEPGVVRLLLGVDPAGQGGSKEASAYYDTHQMTAEARFDIPGMEVRPSDLISAPISEGQTAVFYWTLHPRDAGQTRGTIWLYLRSVDKGTGQESRETVSAQIVGIKSVKLLGLPVNQVRLAAGVGLILGLILCMPLLGMILKNSTEKTRQIT